MESEKENITENDKINKISNHLFSSKYDSVERFIGYYHQTRLISRYKPRSVLEIGIGNKTVSSCLKNHNIEVTTCDFDEKLNPDIVSDIRELNIPEPKFDLVACFEILEHIPFEDVPKALNNIANASKRHVIISIPYAAVYIEVLCRFPWINKIFKKTFLRLFISLPLFTKKFLDKQHYWELGRKGYSKNKIRNALKKNFNIIEEFRPPVDTFHYFFVLEKK